MCRRSGRKVGLRCAMMTAVQVMRRRVLLPAICMHSDKSVVLSFSWSSLSRLTLGPVRSVRFLASPPMATSFGIKSVSALQQKRVRQQNQGATILTRPARTDSPEDARVPQLFKVGERCLGFNNLRPNARLAESCRALGETQETVELSDGLDDGHPRRVVLVEFAVELRGNQPLQHRILR